MPVKAQYKTDLNIHELIEKERRWNIERRRVAEHNNYKDNWDHETAWGPLGGEAAVIDPTALELLISELQNSPELWDGNTLQEITDRVKYHNEEWNKAAKIAEQRRFQEERSIYLLTEDQITQDTPF